MRTIKLSRRSAMKLLLAGSITSLASACGVAQRLPRGRALGSTDGSALAGDVRNALRNHSDTAQLALDISSVEDEVTIKGFVPNDSDIDNVEIIANQVAGVRHVIVNLYVQ